MKPTRSAITCAEELDRRFLLLNSRIDKPIERIELMRVADIIDRESGIRDIIKLLGKLTVKCPEYCMCNICQIYGEIEDILGIN